MYFTWPLLVTLLRVYNLFLNIRVQYCLEHLKARGVLDSLVAGPDKI